MRFARVECAASRRESHCKKALSSRAACGIVAVEAMSEFKFACPVCGQHITADSSTSGGQIECPTCFRKIVVPQAPASQDTKLILSAAQVGKPRPSSLRPDAPLGSLQTAAPRSSLPAVLALLVLLCAAGAVLFVFRDRIFKSARAPTGTNALSQPAAPIALNPTYPIPTNIAWTLDLTNAAFPEAVAAGSIHGSGFRCEKAVLRGGLLSLIQGKAWPWDLSLALNFFARQGEELSGKTVQIPSDRPRAPRVVLRWKDAQQQPATETISGGYALNLVFGEATNGRMPGKIFICLPDSSKSFVAGTFDAEIRKPAPQKPRSPKAPKPKG
jgi:DNA-directed RNA polymerase subunit RPC12/RpoP